MGTCNSSDEYKGDKYINSLINKKRRAEIEEIKLLLLGSIFFWKVRFDKF